MWHYSYYISEDSSNQQLKRNKLKLFIEEALAVEQPLKTRAHLFYLMVFNSTKLDAVIKGTEHNKKIIQYVEQALRLKQYLKKNQISYLKERLKYYANYVENYGNKREHPNDELSNSSYKRRKN